MLAAKGFIIPFDSGVIVIRDWKLNNYLQKDRYHESIYLSEKAQLQEDEMGRYMITDVSHIQKDDILYPLCIQDVSILDTQERDSVVKERLDKANKAEKPPRAPRFIPPTVEDVKAYCTERGNKIDAERFVDFYEAKGWVIGKQPMKSWKAAVRTWEKRGEQTDIRDPRSYAYAEGSL